MTRSRTIGFKNEFQPLDVDRRGIHPPLRVAALSVDFKNSFDAMIGSIGEGRVGLRGLVE